MSVRVNKPPTSETSGPATNPNATTSSLVQSWKNYTTAEKSAASKGQQLTPAQLDNVAAGGTIANGPSSTTTGGPPITGHAPISQTIIGTPGVEYSTAPSTTGGPPITGTAPPPTASTPSALITPVSVAGLSVSPLVIIIGIAGLALLIYLLAG